MKKQIVKEFITVKKVRYLPREEPPPPPPPPRRVLIVGRCTLDVINICNEQPKPGIIERTDEGFWRLGGYAPNTCCVLRRLGTTCEFLGQLTKVPAFESLTNSFQAMGIEISNCPRTNQQPPHRIIVAVRGKAQQSTVEYTNHSHELTYQQFVGAVDYRQYCWIHFELRKTGETIRMVRAVRAYNERSPDAYIVLSVDLADMKPQSCLMAALADYVLIRKQLKVDNGYMNGRETVWAVRDVMDVARRRWQSKQPKKSPYITEEIPELDPVTCRKITSHQPIIIYNNYEEGASCLMPDGKYFKVGPHKPQKIVDAIGEEETFVGAFIYAMQGDKMSMRDAIEYATRAACFKVSIYGFDQMRCMPKDLVACYHA
ncbi:hypothetical protein AWZ03_002367 [Drosophila navojoa]|uniref:Carbohydrate kinase PfkB domain-containing protein n=1 Tax=Drosophila navojoa TaxID=7232 RepID=A0A484BT65_DRONA|nr:ketohexokinase [Drosophila navojoa]TDG51280.1 hypothetical protein AWZ03_002367 [Drosophila navojoa]